MSLMKKSRPAAVIPLALLALAACAAPPLKNAIARGDAAEIARLVDQGSDLDESYGAAHFTPLEFAVQRRRPEIVKLLLEKGSDVNARKNGTSALTQAAINGDLEMVELLLAHGAEATSRDAALASGPDKAAIAARLNAARSSPRAAPASSPSLPQAAERPDDYALVVSIEKYLDAPPARYAENDAREMERRLVALGWPSRNVLTLSGKQAGRAGLEKYVERWLPNNVGKNSRLFFYFAGDGATDPATGAEYLLPWDGDAGMLDKTGYPLSRLYRKLDALDARGVVIVIDAGFSGAGERTAAAPGRPTPAAAPDSSGKDAARVAILLAASAGEEAGTIEADRHGALTGQLIKSLDAQSAAPSSLREIFDRTIAQTIHDAAARGRKQTPRLISGERGDENLRLR